MTTAATRSTGRAHQVVEVTIARSGDDLNMVVRSTGRRGTTTRELRAPEATVRHAAAAVARHYGLARTGPDRWALPADVRPSAA
jgi:fructose 1,6-bisphosphatase